MPYHEQKSSHHGTPMTCITTPSLASACKAGETFDAWCLEQGLTPPSLTIKKKHEHGTRESLAWKLFPHHVLSFAQQHDIAVLDRWWVEQGQALLWKKEDHTPRAEIAYLFSAAAESGSFVVAEWALEQGWRIDVPHTPHDDKLPLHHWITHFVGIRQPEAYDSVLRRLLTPNTVNRQTSQGRTPLSILMSKESVWMLELKRIASLSRRVLQAGADVTLPDMQGRTPLDVLEANQSECVKHFLRPLLYEALHQHEARVLDACMQKEHRVEYERKRGTRVRM